MTTTHPTGIMASVEGASRFSWRSVLAAAAVYAVGAVAVTWPLVRDLRGQVPADLGDPLLNIWALWWDLTHLSSIGTQGYFNANIMYPYANSLAFSEHLTGEAILGLPVWLITGSPVVVYNVLYLLAFVIAGAGAYVLAWRVSGSRVGAFAAGLIFAFAPYRYAQLGHLQVLSSGFIPLAFFFLIELVEKARARDAALFAACVVMQSLSNLYFAVYLALTCPMVFVLAGARMGALGRGRVWLLGGLGAAVAAAALVPFTLPYVRLDQAHGLARDLPAIATNGIQHFLGVSDRNFLWSKILGRFSRGEGNFFPGAAALALAAVGTWRHRATPVLMPTFAVLLLFSMLLSAGPLARIDTEYLKLNVGGAYRLLHDYFPGFGGTRVPGRFFVVGMLALSVFAACGVGALQTLTHRLAGTAVAAILIACLPVEYAATIPAVRYGDAAEPPSMYARLRGLPDGPVVEFPWEWSSNYGWIFHAAIHGKPAFTWFTGHISPIGDVLRRIGNGPASPKSLSLLESMGIRYIVSRHPLGLGGSVPTRTVYKGPDGVVYEILGRGPMFFTPQRDLGDYAAEVDRWGDVVLSARIGAPSGRPVVSRTAFATGVVRLMRGDRTVHESPVRFRLPPVSSGDAWIAGRARVPSGTDFDRVCLRLDGAAPCVEPARRKP